MTKTLFDLAELYLEHMRMLKMSPLTLRGNKYRLKAFLRWLETDKLVQTADQIQKSHLDGWLARLNTRFTYHGLPMKPQAVNTMLGSVRTFLQYLAERGYVMQSLVNVLHYVKIPKLLPGSVLTHAQARKLLSRIDSDSPEGYRNKTMLELLYSSGLRAAELLNINISDVDFAGAIATVIGKGNKQRIVPVGRTALRCLETYLKAVRPYLLKDKNETALFLGKDGKRFTYPHLSELTRRYAVKAKLDINVTAHTFRRSCATELLRAGANMYHVKDLLGHESLDTLKHYAKLTITDLKKTHEKCHPREKDI